MKKLALLLLFFVGHFSSVYAQKKPPKIPEWQTEVEKMIEFYAQNDKNYGIAIGIIEHGKTFEFFGGKISDNNPLPPDSLSLFEIGGTNKIFLAFATLKAVEKGILKDLNQPISDFFDVDNPYLKQITIQHLLTHTAGFPRYPDNLKFVKTNDNQPWENYTQNELIAYLSDYKAREFWQEGKGYEYSDIGYIILSKILIDVGFPIPSSMKAIEGHKSDGTETDNWICPPFVEPAVNATQNLATLTQVILQTMNPKENTSTIKKQLTPQIKVPNQKAKACYGWHLVKAKKVGWNVYTHSGKTTGHRSFVAFCPPQNSAVVILSNTNTPLVDNIGVQILDLILK